MCFFFFYSHWEEASYINASIKSSLLNRRSPIQPSGYSSAFILLHIPSSRIICILFSSPFPSPNHSSTHCNLSSSPIILLKSISPQNKNKLMLPLLLNSDTHYLITFDFLTKHDTVKPFLKYYFFASSQLTVLSSRFPTTFLLVGPSLTL